MSKLIQEIERLQAVELKYNNIQNKMIDIKLFIDLWDSGDPAQLPADNNSKIDLIRNFYEFSSKV